jgi:hypothetical protein
MENGKSDKSDDEFVDFSDDDESNKKEINTPFVI